MKGLVCTITYSVTYSVTRCIPGHAHALNCLCVVCISFGYVGIKMLSILLFV